MDSAAASQTLNWLEEGGIVVAASERAARALEQAIHRARQQAGLQAWPAPNVYSWSAFVRRAWDERCPDALLLLNPIQEEALWSEIAGREETLAALLEASRRRLGALAMEAHQLLCLHAPQALAPARRRGWSEDAAVFSRWLDAFEGRCRDGGLIAPARLAPELAALLGADDRPRQPMLLVGFDRLTAAQRAVLEAWGGWRQVPAGPPAQQVSYTEAPDPHAELEACAAWCARTLRAEPGSRLMVLAQNAADRRGEIERAFLTAAEGSEGRVDFEFSMGVPLISADPVRAALLCLRWLSAPLEEPELNWLLASGLAAASAEQAEGLRLHARALRDASLARTRWDLDAFLRARPRASSLPASWLAAIDRASKLLESRVRRTESPLAWCELALRLLESLPFGQGRALGSTAFQALDSLRQLIESCGSLGFDGRRVAWREFLRTVERAAAEALFAPESSGAPILITGPAEAAGLDADGIWFLGVDENTWPAAGQPHPLLPLALAREAGLPHASPQLDHDLASAQTARILGSTSEVHFSYARMDEDGERRPSRLAIEAAGPPEPMPAGDRPPAPAPAVQQYSDRSRVPFAPGPVRGGAAVLSNQSQCPFRAFARARLDAAREELAQPCLTPAERGSLVHSVLHSIWAGPPDGIRSHAELIRIPDRRAFVAAHVRRTMASELPEPKREHLPVRLVELEAERLTRLVAEWLEYEAARVAFTVAATEQDRTAFVEGLSINLRLDRLDRLADDTVLVVDYKTGSASPADWDPPRPRDVQLPLYAGFALDRERELPGGLVFARILTGQQMGFAGRVGDAVGMLLPGISRRNALVTKPFGAEMLIDWKRQIEQLAKDFLGGNAQVNPADYPNTCEYCGLEAVCRVKEQELAEDAAEDEEADD